MACVMMDGRPTRPNKMVTHNWANLFTDLIGAIVADALDDDTYDLASFMVSNHIDKLIKVLREQGTSQKTYWVCAFSVGQHNGICGENPFGDKDNVLETVHPACDCGLPKYFNATPPLDGKGRSIGCEMNKFDDMME